MATEVVMPRLSDTMDSGTVARWLKQEGDAVKRGEVIAEIETDKANMELESYADGVLARIVVGEGQSVGLGQPIAVIAADQAEAQALGEEAGDGAGATMPGSEHTPAGATAPDSGESPSQVAYGEDASSDVEGGPVAPPTERVRAASERGRAAPQTDSAGPPSAAAGPPPRDRSDGRIKASPLARRMAQEHGIELGGITGSGPGGRITKEDVQAVLRGQASPAPQVQPAQPTTAAPAAPPRPEPTLAPAADGQRAPQPVEMSRMQRTIARRVAASRFSAPDFVLTAELDMTEARALLRQVAGTEGAPKVGPNDLLIKAVATALREHPDVNAGWEGDGIVHYGRVNVGFNVAIEGGLVVPVIQDADQKSLGTIAREAKELISKARGGKLAPHEYEGGTFSISNLGMYQIDQFTPIINTPEACILGVGAMAPKPVVVDGELAVRERMRVTLACDHRVVNGAEGAQFLQTLRRLLENPMLTIL